MKRQEQQRGFTLVEIAIVLVIIGLLLGGILKGQEMITQAKIKNVIADMTGISAAMYGYQDRYRALPGDDKNAGTAGGGSGRWGAQTASGNGDGNIQGVYTVAANVGAPAVAQEAGFFWHHLRLAGFISGTGVDQPFNAINGKMGVQTGGGQAPGSITGVLSDGTTSFSALMLCSANLPDKIAISVDSQTDDGLGKNGTVRAYKTTTPNDAINANASDYTEDGVSMYIVCRLL